ncbi:unnamed protein product [Alopecurus aequalis]
MATSPPPSQNPNSGGPTEAANPVAASPAASARTWTSLFAGPLPSKETRLLAAISDLRRPIFRGCRHRDSGLPLPICAADSTENTGNVAIVRAILEDIVQHTLSNLHSIEKSLTFWQSRADGTSLQKMYFMIFERGPRAFVEATCQTLTRLRSYRSPSDYLVDSAYDTISTKLAGLTSIQHCLSAFLAEVYSETSKCVEGLTESSDKSLYTLFVVLNTVFPKLETSIRNSVEGKNLVNTHDKNSYQPLFKILPEFDIQSSQWTEVLSTNALSLIYQNLEKLDAFVSSQVSSHKKPGRMTIYWLPYTCGAIGLSVCSLWLLRHSSLVGSSDMDNWIRYAKESVTAFRDKPDEKSTSSLGDEGFQTFKESLNRLQGIERSRRGGLYMLFVCACPVRRCPLDRVLIVHVMKSEYDEESTIENLFNQKLTLARLIQIQEIDLSYQKASLTLIRDQFQKLSETLAALRACGVPLLLIYLVRALVMHSGGAAGYITRPPTKPRERSEEAAMSPDLAAMKSGAASCGSSRALHGGAVSSSAKKDSVVS